MPTQEKQRYEFQPTLEDGTPIGGMQVIMYEDQTDLVKQIQDSYVNLYRRNRTLMQEKELSKPSVAPPEPTGKLRSRTLTAQERLQFIRDVNDPDKVDAALDLAIEAKLGAKPEAVSAKIESTNENSESVRAGQEAQDWVSDHPEFYPSQQNRVDMATWVQNHFGPTGFRYENFDKAYAALTALLEQRPAGAGNQTDNPSNTTQPTALPSVKKASDRSDLPTMTTRRQASSGDVPVKGLTRAEVNRMSPDEYKRRLQDPVFAKRVDELFA